jgi:hypothetical protein
LYIFFQSDFHLIFNFLSSLPAPASASASVSSHSAERSLLIHFKSDERDISTPFIMPFAFCNNFRLGLGRIYVRAEKSELKAVSGGGGEVKNFEFQIIFSY